MNKVTTKSHYFLFWEYYNQADYEMAWKEISSLCEKESNPVNKCFKALMLHHGKGTKADRKKAYREAQKLLKALEKDKSKEAYYLLGRCYLDAIGTKTIGKIATKYLIKATEKRYSLAHLELGLQNCKGKKKNYTEAHKQFLLGRKYGSLDAVYMLGQMYHKGQGVKACPNTALAYMEEAAKDNHLPATIYLGEMYYADKNIEENYEKAFACFLKAANRNDVESTDNVAYMLTHALGTRKNIQEAIIWYKKSAAHGFAESYFGLGVIYDHAIDVPRNVDLAIEYYTEAIERGHRDAHYHLGRLYDDDKDIKQDLKKAFDYYLTAAKKGHKDAAYRVGRMCELGLGTEKNPDEAYKWFKKAALQKHKTAALKVADNFVTKKIQHKETDTEFLELIRIAAEYEHLESMFYLGGLAYVKGVSEHTKHNIDSAIGKENEHYVEARKWIQKCADKGLMEAGYILANILGHGLATPVDRKKSMEWLLKVADAGVPFAMHDIGVAYLSGVSGTVVQRDHKKAFYFIEKAFNTKYESVTHGIDTLTKIRDDSKIGNMIILAMLYIEGKGTEQNTKKGLDLLKQAADLNSVAALESLANAYTFEKHGIEQDISLAKKYLQKAIELGSENAKQNLKTLETYEHKTQTAEKQKEDNIATEIVPILQQENGKLRDPEAILKYIQQHKETLSADVIYKTGNIIYETKKESYELIAFKCHQIAADKGHFRSIACVAQIYGRGTDDIKKDIVKARAMFTSIPEDEKEELDIYTEAFSYSQHPDQDLPKAIDMLEALAANGNEHAMFQLGNFHFVAEFNMLDLEKAYHWFCKAGEKNSSDAFYSLGQMYYGGLYVTACDAEAYKYFRKAADLGFARATNALGVMYACGNHVNENLAKAKKYFKQAAEEGVLDAKTNLLLLQDQKRRINKRPPSYHY